MANIKNELNNIKSAIYGKDVRESIHDGIDAINKEVESTTGRQVDLENTFAQLVINAGNSNAEIVDARVKSDGTSYSKLGDRLNEVDSQLAHNMMLNNMYSRDYKTIILDNLVANSDISDIVNTTLAQKDVIRVVLPVGNFTVSKTIEVPSKKTLQLQGSYKDNNGFYALAPRTRLKLTTDNTSMIKLRTEATIDGGLLDLGECSNSQAIRLDFWEEGHSRTKAVNTMILGSRTRNKNQIGVLMECDSPTGLKNGYGVFCDFDLSMFCLSIGYHLHRHNSTWQDGPSDIVWMTEAYIKGDITHCNRYIWFDTIGGWGGDSSHISATIQCGAIVGVDYPGIELNCSSVNITGNIWDFGGSGLQQTAIKLNSKSSSNLIIGERSRNHIIDEGKNNLVFNDLVKDYQTEVLTQGFSTPNMNSLLGNEDKLNYEITVHYKDGSSSVIKDIYSLSYQQHYGYCIDGIKNLEYLFKPVTSNNFHVYNSTTIDSTKVDKLDVTFNFTQKVSISSLGVKLKEVYLPNNVSISLQKDGKWEVLEDKTFFAEDGSYRSVDEFMVFKDLYQEYSNGKYTTIPKQYRIEKVKFSFDGKLEHSTNTANIVCLGNIFMKIMNLQPNFCDKYLYDYSGLNVKLLNGEDAFGECILDVDFSRDSDVDLDNLFGVNPNISREVVDGKLEVKGLSGKDYFTMTGQYSNKIAIMDIEFNFNTISSVYALNGNFATRLLSGRRIFVCANSCEVATIQKIFETNEYLRINKIKVYNKPTREEKLDFTEINSKFSNYLGF